MKESLYADFKRQRRWSLVGFYLYLVVGWAVPILTLLTFSALLGIDTVQNNLVALDALVSWWPVYLALALIGISTTVVQFLTLRFDRIQAKRRARVEQAVAMLDRLRTEHPELADVNDLNLTIKALRDEDAGQRNFWIGVFMSVFFLALGFLLSHIFAVLGWPH